MRVLCAEAGDGAAAGASKRKRGGAFDVERIPVRLGDIKDRKGFSPVDSEYEDEQKVDAVARYRGSTNSGDGGDDDGPTHRALLLQGHVDVWTWCPPRSQMDGPTRRSLRPRIGRHEGWRRLDDLRSGSFTEVMMSTVLHGDEGLVLQFLGVSEDVAVNCMMTVAQVPRRHQGHDGNRRAGEEVLPVQHVGNRARQILDEVLPVQHVRARPSSRRACQC